ncbi:MAG TPA: sigma-70 family RNA polymerase sigma factor [Nocardioidaceae bacterium]|nr:sigma-70 family RNA polymerase sigma factor [Nocardioidaceae bacterium]
MSVPMSDDVLVAGLRARDEDVFTHLLTNWSRSMLRLARSFVSTEASAEEVVQDTWVAVIQGIDRFEGRSSLRTWVYRILVNTARKRGVKEHRSVPWSSLSPIDDDRGPTVDPAAFRGADDQYPGGWKAFPGEWASTESSVLASEVRTTVKAALDLLPERQRIVITLRDVLGHTSDEVCEMLDISTANQRVLLHRARAAVRARLADYLADPPPSGRGVLGEVG